MGRGQYLARVSKPKNFKGHKRTEVDVNGNTFTLCEPYSGTELRKMAKELGTRIRKKNTPEQTRRKLAKKDTENVFGLK